MSVEVPDVERPVVGGAEDVHPGPLRQPVGEVPLAPLRRGHRPGELDGAAEGVHVVAAEAPDQRVQHLDGGPGVVQRPVVGLGRGAEVRRQRAQLAVGDLVPGQHPPGQRHRVEHPGVGPAVTVLRARRLEETHVVRRVVGHQHRVGEELQEGRQHRLDRRRRGDHRLGDAGQHGDEGRDRLPGVDQGAQRAELHAAADLHRADLGDPAAIGGAAGGLQVHHHEGGPVQGEFVGVAAVDRAVRAEQRILHEAGGAGGFGARRGGSGAVGH